MGTYRISSTRGGGFLNVFFADDSEGELGKEAASDDMEVQTLVLVEEEELYAAVMGGRFKESKWAQTVSMSLLWLAGQRRKKGEEA